MYTIDILICVMFLCVVATPSQLNAEEYNLPTNLHMNKGIIAIGV